MLVLTTKRWSVRGEGREELRVGAGARFGFRWRGAMAWVTILVYMDMQQSTSSGGHCCIGNRTGVYLPSSSCLPTHNFGYSGSQEGEGRCTLSFPSD